MNRVATAVVLIPLVLLAVLRAPVSVLAAIVAVVAVLTTREFLDLSERYGVQPFRLPTYIAIGVLFFLMVAGSASAKPMLAASAGIATAAVIAVLAPFVFLALGMRRAELSSVLPAAATSVTALVK